MAVLAGFDGESEFGAVRVAVFVGDFKPPGRQGYFAAGRALAGGLVMSAYSNTEAFELAARSNGLGRASVVRCDHCREQLGLSVHRYWHMQFCSSACMTAYQQRLSPETKVKIAWCFAFANLRDSVARHRG